MNTHIYIIKKNAPCESSNQLEIKKITIRSIRFSGLKLKPLYKLHFEVPWHHTCTSQFPSIPTAQHSLPRRNWIDEELLPQWARSKVGNY